MCEGVNVSVQMCRYKGTRCSEKVNSMEMYR